MSEEGGGIERGSLLLFLWFDPLFKITFSWYTNQIVEFVLFTLLFFCVAHIFIQKTFSNPNKN